MFRLDFQAELQSGCAWIVRRRAGLAFPERLASENVRLGTARNRMGIQGHFFKQVEFEVERELTEKN